ncbi:MAG TPA: hypothetical protein IGS31_12540 [Oscillatoriales cyanobacterium M4454_W2019_049]|nr:hypothetical protein [Oscillatoriales cyanobacterium M4454_W2019_049]
MLLLRLLRFLEVEFGESLPPSLAEAARDFEPFTLAEILRQRRLTVWELPRLRGWLRWGASRLGMKLKHTYPTLESSDLVGWIADIMTARRMATRPLNPHCSPQSSNALSVTLG